MKLWIRAGLGRAYKKPGLEVYPHGRYFTLTGWMLPHSPSKVEERQDELEALWSFYARTDRWGKCEDHIIRVDVDGDLVPIGHCCRNFP